MQRERPYKIVSIAVIVESRRRTRKRFINQSLLGEGLLALLSCRRRRLSNYHSSSSVNAYANALEYSIMMSGLNVMKNARSTSKKDQSRYYIETK